MAILVFMKALGNSGNPYGKPLCRIRIQAHPADHHDHRAVWVRSDLDKAGNLRNLQVAVTCQERTIKLKLNLNAASTVQQAFCLRLCNVVLYCRSSFTE